MLPHVTKILSATIVFDILCFVSLPDVVALDLASGDSFLDGAPSGPTLPASKH